MNRFALVGICVVVATQVVSMQDHIAIYDQGLSRAMQLNDQVLSSHVETIRYFGQAQRVTETVQHKYGLDQSDVITAQGYYVKSQDRLYVTYDLQHIPVVVALYAKLHEKINVSCNKNLPDYCKPQRYLDAYVGTIECQEGVFQVYEGRAETMRAIICFRLLNVPEQDS